MPKAMSSLMCLWSDPVEVAKATSIRSFSDILDNL